MEKLLEIDAITVTCHDNDRTYNIVNDLSLSIGIVQIVGIVGEPGCGKSTLAHSITQLLPASFRVTGGTIKYRSQDIRKMKDTQFRRWLGEKIGFIFQDPMVSLNPMLNIGTQITEKLRLYSSLKKAEIYQRAINVMQEVGFIDPESIYFKYPHELSGGMKQRAVIASAIINKPELIIADEPTTALDPTIQIQILKLIYEISKKYNSSILLISHDFGVINQICDLVGVMYNGEIVELSNVKNIFDHPIHPYTKGLIECIPNPKQRNKPLKTIPGYIEHLQNNSGKCFFCDRCENTKIICTKKHPKLKEVLPDHSVRCFFT